MNDKKHTPGPRGYRSRLRAGVVNDTESKEVLE